MSIYARDTTRVKLTYTVGTDVVSNYIWRGFQVAGVGLQPDLAIGYGGAYLDAWFSLNATDWTFQKPCNATNNAFYPEMDITLGFSRWGLDIKYMHLFYFDHYADGTPSRFFDYSNPTQGGAQQEWRAKYRISDQLPLHVLWCTRTWGRDGYTNANNERQRAYSSYLEVGYEFPLPHEWTLDANLGITPWKSFYTLYQADFAVVNMHAKLRRNWDVHEHCRLNVFAELMLNPYDCSRQTWGDSSYTPINGGQKVLWNIGVGVWLK